MSRGPVSVVSLAPDAVAANEECQTALHDADRKPGDHRLWRHQWLRSACQEATHPEERDTSRQRPPTASAASWGDLLPQRVTRAIILAGGCQLHRRPCGSLARNCTCRRPNARWRAPPPIPARGQGGAGEILSLSHAFDELARNNEVAEKDVLSLINGSPAAAALVADTALAADRRLALAVEVFALAAEAFNVPLSHYAEALGEFGSTSPTDGRWLNCAKQSATATAVTPALAGRR